MEDKDYYKIGAMLTKRPDIGYDEFRSYYENHHCKLICLIPGVKKYFRRYLRPFDQTHFDSSAVPFSVLTELWFESRADLERALEALRDPTVSATLAEDEEKFLDRSKARQFVFDEVQSDLTVDASGD